MAEEKAVAEAAEEKALAEVKKEKVVAEKKGFNGKDHWFVRIPVPIKVALIGLAGYIIAALIGLAGPLISNRPDPGVEDPNVTVTTTQDNTEKTFDLIETTKKPPFWKVLFSPKATEPPTTEPPPTTTEPFRFHDKEIIKFGGFEGYGELEWRVLTTKWQGQEALIITEYLLGSTAFDEAGSTRWDNCSLRSELNNMLDVLFSDEEKTRIIETEITTPGSVTTRDNLFLLKDDEVEKYFGDSHFAYLIEDKDNKDKRACYWWTRSPVYVNENVVGVSIISNNSDVFVYRDVTDHINGVRPAMWIKA